MSFSLSQKGIKKVELALKRVQQASPRLMRDISDEANKRHALAYRRRWIPRKTGRLSFSLRHTRHPDRMVIVMSKYIKIATLVPYASKHRHRIRPLTRNEMIDIFVNPALEALQELLAGRS